MKSGRYPTQPHCLQMSDCVPMKENSPPLPPIVHWALLWEGLLYFHLDQAKKGEQIQEHKHQK